MENPPGKRSSLRVKVLLLVLAGALLAGGSGVGGWLIGRETAPGDAGGAAGRSDTSSASSFDFSTLNEIRSILDKEYVKPDNLDDQQLYEAAINGLLGTLSDAGTFYVDSQTYKVSFLPSGTFDGIGATIAQQNSEIIIVAPIKGTPAEAAGIRSGDVVMAVDGESTAGWSTEKTVLKIRGPRGTKVTVSIRHADNKTEDYVLTRAQIPVESVSTTPPGGVLRDGSGAEVSGIGYVHIREFSARTPQELDEALKDVVSKGAKALIIDVRSNPGGLLQATITVADMFLDSGTVLIQRDRDGRERPYGARAGEAVDKNMPIVVLQNRFSASAAEVLAAALGDNGRATVIGEKSFGKGTVNISRDLKDGGALFVSIAQWLTPKGALIDKVGVRPDIEVILSDEDIDLRRDPQLTRAIDVLRGQLKASASSPAAAPTP